MPGIGTAMIGSAAIGLAGSIFGSSKASHDASKSRRESARQHAESLAFARERLEWEKQQSASATGLARDALEWQKERYKQWQRVFGNIMDNLGNYYNNLSSDRIAARGLQAQQKAYQQAQQNIRENLARRGLSGSKFEDYINAMGEMANATARADIRATAEDKMRQQQMAFLGMGLGAGAQKQAAVGQAYGRAQQSYAQAGAAVGQAYGAQSALAAQRSAQMAGIADQQQSRADQAMQGFYGDMTSFLGTAVGQYAAGSGGGGGGGPFTYGGSSGFQGSSGISNPYSIFGGG